jgi:hypothetical protein
MRFLQDSIGVGMRSGGWLVWSLGKTLAISWVGVGNWFLYRMCRIIVLDTVSVQGRVGSNVLSLKNRRTLYSQAYQMNEDNTTVQTAQRILARLVIQSITSQE